MKGASWVFDEQLHRAALSDVRVWLEDELHHHDLGRIDAHSRRAFHLELLARIHDQYNSLLIQTISGQLVDSLARRANSLLWNENKFLRREMTYYRCALGQERATAAMLDEWIFKDVLNSRQGGAIQI